MSNLRLLHLHIVVATQVAILAVVYRRFECEKRRKYEQQTEMGSFTLLVFSTLSGGMGHMLLSAVFYRRLALLVSSEGVVSYSSVMSWCWQGVLVTLGIIKNNLNKIVFMYL